MAIDLTGINNKNEYYTNHYISTIFEQSVKDTVKKWSEDKVENAGVAKKSPVSLLSDSARAYNTVYERFSGGSEGTKLSTICDMADMYLAALGYENAHPDRVQLDNSYTLPIYHAVNKPNGTPALWVLLTSTSAKSREDEGGILDESVFDAESVGDGSGGYSLYRGLLSENSCEDIVGDVFFGDIDNPPRFIMLIGMRSIALLDRNKWNEKRYLEFDLEEIFSRREHSTFQAMAVLLHKTSLCPDEGVVLLDDFDEESRRNASGVSANLKYALRECIELLGNEVLYYEKTHSDGNFDASDVDAGELTLECLRYMYRMLFVLFIESRPELGYAPMKDLSYYASYSLESLREIAENVKADSGEIGEGYYVYETLSGLFDMIYNGYPVEKDELEKLRGEEGIHDVFYIAPLKGHIFDPDRTPMINEAKLRNSCMLQIIDKMSYAYDPASKRRVRISYSNLGINQLGSVYEALLSYRGFIAKEDLYEVKKADEKIDELDVGYFVSANELEQYTEDERARYESGENKGKLRIYKKGYFIYRLAGREREKSASYYTPESLTKCLVKYSLEELLKGKSADEILHLTICEPAMGSAAFINEAINQLAEAYIQKKQEETGEIIKADDRVSELQRVKMYIADRNVYGIDLNPVAVELGEVSIWLNSIYEGGYVPWFGTQLVNGNSLIGARRQVYKAKYLTKNSAQKWYDIEPERFPFDRERVAKKSGANDNREIYHFLLGDPGMCNYTDKVIKNLCQDEIKKINKWKKNFMADYTESDIQNLLRLSESIDKLWKEHIDIRKKVIGMTRDNLSVFGNVDTEYKSYASIREKDSIYAEICKTEEMENAGPYARLKLAMDYWCALWFWPIDKADLLPTRSEFLTDMALILDGNIDDIKDPGSKLGRHVGDDDQLSMFPTELEEQIKTVLTEVGELGTVDIPKLKEKYERINLVTQIAESNKFMHWELEFADMFADRGGFDLIIGNPPWVKLEWIEGDVLADVNPIFAIRNLSILDVAKRRSDVLSEPCNLHLYLNEYVSMAGQQNFLSADQNYYVLKRQRTNLFKCFLPQGWMYTSNCGVSAYVHPNGVFDDPHGGVLREEIYSRIKKHFMFTNEMRLFADVHPRTYFSLNVYGQKGPVSFDNINNLFSASTIEECYTGNSNAPIPKIRNEHGQWNTVGHPDRILHITEEELRFFSKLFNPDSDWKQTPLPTIYTSQYLKILTCFADQTDLFGAQRDVYVNEMWNETSRQIDGTILRRAHFPESLRDTIYSGPHISVANPLFRTARRISKNNGDYDNIDLTQIDKNYIQRVNYTIGCDLVSYSEREPSTPWRNKYPDNYRLCFRVMLNNGSERTLVGAVIPKETEHIYGLVGVCMHHNFMSFVACCFSLPYDFFLKITGKDNLTKSVLSSFPVLDDTPILDSAICRALLLNCLTSYYSDLWRDEYKVGFADEEWSKEDSRLDNGKFENIVNVWNSDTPLRTDYERRQALVEIDVLIAMALGMTLEQLKAIYNLSFPILQKNEASTWYDANGRIAFTANVSYNSNVGFTRAEWENGIKGAQPGQKFTRTITDDTMPGGPIQRTMEYVAPFDRCDRIKDYETAWAFFENKFKQ